jgi:hypothetical protein
LSKRSKFFLLYLKLEIVLSLHLEQTWNTIHTSHVPSSGLSSCTMPDLNEALQKGRNWYYSIWLKARYQVYNRSNCVLKLLPSGRIYNELILRGDYLHAEPKRGFVSQLWSWYGRKQCNKYVRSSYNKDVVCRLSHRVALPLTMIMALFSAFLMSRQGWECEYPYSIHSQLILVLDHLYVGCEYVYANALISFITPLKSWDHAHYICPVVTTAIWSLFDFFSGKRLILFHWTHEHTKHQSSENLHFGFCYAFPSITYS